MMKHCVSLLSFFMILQLSIAASTHDPKQGISLFAEESEDAPIVSSQRGALEFGLMILCHVDKNPLDYNGYGCFCGLGGEGEPKDDTDRCCQIHDQCYNEVQLSGSCPFETSIYVMPYSRKNCYLCEPVDYYWFYGECRNALCQCDSEAVQCFKRSKSTFNPSLKSYPQENC